MVRNQISLIITAFLIIIVLLVFNPFELQSVHTAYSHESTCANYLDSQIITNPNRDYCTGCFEITADKIDCYKQFQPYVDIYWTEGRIGQWMNFVCEGPDDPSRDFINTCLSEEERRLPYDPDYCFSSDGDDIRVQGYTLINQEERYEDFCQGSYYLYEFSCSQEGRLVQTPVHCGGPLCVDGMCVEPLQGDSDFDGNISVDELLAAIDSWISRDIDNLDLLNIISAWGSSQ